MARLDPGATARRLARAARHAASSLKSEYEAGKSGDDSPTTPIFPTPKEQLDALLGLLKPKPERNQGETAADGAAPMPDAAQEAGADADVTTTEDADADAVADALRRVDWQQVKAATAERTGDAARAMRSMAEHVDWAKVQPVAAQVSSALIAAVASGRVPLGGPLGPIVARALNDRGALTQRVGQSLVEGKEQLPPDFRPVIETTAEEL